MSGRGAKLAQQFEAANDELIKAVDGCSDEQWRATCAGEQWSVAVTAHHVAVSHEGIAGFIQAIANGQPVPPLTGEMLEQGNAEHARQYANCTKNETVELLRRNGKAAASMLRGLSDEQLERGAEIPLVGGRRMTASEMAEMVLIGHPRSHLESIRAAL